MIGGRCRYFRIAACLCPLVFLFTGCAQRWVFAPAGQTPLRIDRPSPNSALLPTPVEFSGSDEPTGVEPVCHIERLPPLTDPYSACPAPDSPPMANPPVVETPIETGERAVWLRRPFGGRFAEGAPLFRAKVRQDHCHFYDWPTMRDLALGVGAASLLANTSLDHDFRDWVQDDVRSHDADNFADFWKPFGNGKIVVPSLVGIGLAGWLFDETSVAGAAGTYGRRTGRAFLVGAPPMVFTQYALGASRPGELPRESSWRPFSDNNAVSGHAFIGAVPFITAAQMCDNRCAKVGFYALSTLPCWARTENDAHYLSQVGLGWWFAYLACQSVGDTEADPRFSIAPLFEPGTAGVAATYAF